LPLTSCFQVEFADPLIKSPEYSLSLEGEGKDESRNVDILKVFSFLPREDKMQLFRTDLCQIESKNLTELSNVKAGDPHILAKKPILRGNIPRSFLEKICGTRPQTPIGEGSAGCFYRKLMCRLNPKYYR